MKDLFENLFVFEMANNHQGSVDHGVQIIREMGKIARKYNIRAGVKFQYRDLNTLIHSEYKERKDVKHIPRFLETRLSESQYQILIDAVRKENMITVTTPFDENSVHQCIDHGIQILKVASCSALDWPLLEVIAGARKPVIISTGGLSIYDIDNIVSFFTHQEANFALMHCVGLYPTPSDKVFMNFMEKMIKRYRGIPVGYSGHESPDNLDVVKVAVTKGAKILERHVGVSTDTITLNKYSMNPEETDAWVASALLAKEISGRTGTKEVTQAEIDSLLSLKRCVFADIDIPKGKVIERSDVFFSMPCAENQLNSGDFGKYRATFIASNDYKRLAPISEHFTPDIYSITRGVVHDAKGMLYEAGIELGDDITIELSHQHGLSHLRETGAILASVINREYCKKIIIMLPGQRHPTHHHRKKEETFQLLWGDLEVGLEDKAVRMKAGDKLLVERNVPHWFSTTSGAIFEEISTTSFRDDSYYKEPKIATLDPMQRKTVIENW